MRVFLFIVAVVIGADAITGNFEFHTAPDKWEEPRFFQTPIEKEMVNELLNIQPVPVKAMMDEIELDKREFSPNNAYWFVKKNIETASGDQNGQIYIFNERDYLIELAFEYYANFGVQTEWMNEKLMYLRIWCRRVLALDLIFDVEEEKIIYCENTHDGERAYRQYHKLN